MPQEPGKYWTLLMHTPNGADFWIIDTTGKKTLWKTDGNGDVNVPVYAGDIIKMRGEVMRHCHA